VPKVPRVAFSVNKYVNLFYHVCVLFSEYFPDEYSLGILNNSIYRQQHAHLKTESLHRKFQTLYQCSYYTWDYVGKSLFRTNDLTEVKETLRKTSLDAGDVWSQILSEALPRYESIWRPTKAKLSEYKSKFETEWRPNSDSILKKMTNIAKLPWTTKSINVHLVDCVYGASSWLQDVVAPPFPEVDVEKKLLAHEITHILIPEYFLRAKLQEHNLDYAISHTIVDLVAYFAVKEHVTDHERKGIRPNPDYYTNVPQLYPVFEDCYRNPRRHHNFDEILRQIKL